MKKKIIKFVTLTFFITLIVLFVVYESNRKTSVNSQELYNTVTEESSLSSSDTIKLIDSIKKLRIRLPSSKVLIMDDLRIFDVDSILNDKKKKDGIATKEK